MLFGVLSVGRATAGLSDYMDHVEGEKKKMTLAQKNNYADIVYGQERDSLLQDYLSELWSCARIEIKNPYDSGLPPAENLPIVEEVENPCRVRLGAIRERAMEKTNKSKRHCKDCMTKLN